MNDLEKVISKMDFSYFGTGQHHIEVEAFIARPDSVMLDVRAQEEVDTVQLHLKRHCEVLHIPTDEVPRRLGEIPKDRTIGVFCSAGVRAAIIFVYLKSKGYGDVRILPDGYPPLMEAVKPGKLYKQVCTEGTAK
jgi:rhodanese-related sulfurtransferase